MKESIDAIRQTLGLPRLPSLQEENDKLQSSYFSHLFIYYFILFFCIITLFILCHWLTWMCRYLEKRRKNWNEETPAPTTRNSKKRKKG